MSGVELKNHLKSKIDEIEDEAFLSEINAVLNQHFGTSIVLSDEQLSAVKGAKAQYVQGNFVENSVVNEEIEKWLNE